jgi:hypothetical protein
MEKLHAIVTLWVLFRYVIREIGEAKISKDVFDNVRRGFVLEYAAIAGLG